MSAGKTFYLETFGCQMNVHDSEKVIGTLLHEGYRQVESVEQADLILYNTCSIRDKAEQKVFHRLADFKKLQASGKKFGVLGCVAQQEGEKIFERAPHVSLVCGSASYTNLPQMLKQLEALDAGSSRTPAFSPAGGGISLTTGTAREPESRTRSSQLATRNSSASPGSTTAPPTNVSKPNTLRAPTRIAGTSPSSKAAINSAPTASCLSRAAKSAAALRSRSSPKPARWPIWATRKFSCWVRT